jgi:hypothetical protein
MAIMIGLGSAWAQDASQSVSAPGATPGEQAQSARTSLNWMTQTLQRMAAKLEAISEKIDLKSTQEDVEKDVKEAIHDVLSELAPETNRGSSSTNAAEPSNVPESGRNEKRGAVKKSLAGDIASSSFGDSSSTSTNGSLRIDLEASSPFLSEKAPKWVREAVISDELVRLPIASSLCSTLSECREDLKDRLVLLVHQALQEKVLRSSEKIELKPLTKQYIEDHLIRPDQEFDNEMERPSGTYHQLYQLVQIGPEELREIKSWERNEVTRERTRNIGLIALVGLTALSGLSGGANLLARREQRLRAKRASA